MFTLLAVDLDGTLLRNDHTISDFSADTLIHAQKKGLTVALCTGRPTDGARHIAERLRLHEFGGFLIGYNGGEIIECKNNKVIRDLLLPDGVLPKIVQFAQSLQTDIVTFCDGHIIATSDTNPFILRSSVRNKMNIVKTANWLKAAEDLPLHKCMLVGDPKRLIPMELQVKMAFDGVLEAFCSEPQFLEFTPLGINKGDGLQWLMNNLNLSPSEVIAFGDTPGDIPMLRLAGLGIAMANSPESVRAIADTVAPSNAEDGVARMLEKLLWHEMDF